MGGEGRTASSECMRVVCIATRRSQVVTLTSFATLQVTGFLAKHPTFHFIADLDTLNNADFKLETGVAAHAQSLQQIALDTDSGTTEEPDLNNSEAFTRLHLILSSSLY